MRKLAIFDLDGTLVDSLSSIADACNKALTRNGLDKRNLDEYKYFAGDGALELVKRAVYVSGDTNYEKLDDVFNSYKEIFEKDCTIGVKPFDEINNLLDELKKRNVKLAVLTNKPHNRALDVVAKVFGENFFDEILGYKDEETKKPNPYGALKICEKLGVEPKDCVYIGDTDTDVKTGINANMYTVGVTWGFRDREELIENNAHLVIDSPLELINCFN